MILADTSVVIEYVRGRDAKVVGLVPTLPLAICGVVRAELLCGARDRKHRTDLINLLAAFHHLVIPDSLWDIVGDHLAKLRSQGITVPFADVAIATLAIAKGVEIWSRDPHYQMMRSALPALKVFQEPP
jgi:predicted nucleic acid-binding protein